LLASIPIVALFFTWFHIWLAIQMMFRPLKFFGVWQYRDTGMGIGWQGVVPRKSHKMARTAYACARPYLLGPRDWLTRVDANVLMTKIRPHILGIVRSSLDDVVGRHFPDVNRQLPPAVQQELVLAAVEKVEEGFADLWSKFTELLCDEGIGIDNDGMVVTVFTENVSLLNSFFLKLGDREFRFIERCGAALGFCCGLLQLSAFNHLTEAGRQILLPMTGFVLGIFTNWLAILVCFKPVKPWPVYICGWHAYDIQGLFLKRQKDVAILYSRMLCDHFFDFHKVVAYLRTRPELWKELKQAYQQHNSKVMDKTLGRAGSCFVPFVVGKRQFRVVEQDLQATLVKNLSMAEEMHTIAGKFIQVASDIFRTNALQMQKMPPDEFENLLHPVFKEDEWILILLGGILGAIVGFAQVHFLSE